MSLIYCMVPFAAALLLPNRQLLAEFAAIFLPLLIWAGVNGNYASPFSVLLSFACGLAFRRAAGSLHRLLARKRRMVFIALAGSALAAMLPGSLAIGHTVSAKYRDWEMRPPAEGCLAGKYAVTIAGVAYYLPASPTITINAGQTAYHLQSGKSQRTICERTHGGRTSIHAQNVLIDTGIPLRGPFCRLTRSAWNLDFCADARNAGRLYPTLVHIYSVTEYDRQHLASAYTYQDFVESREKAIRAGHPFAQEQAGIFDRYANGYWVARDGAWNNDAGEPYTLKCENSAQQGILTCSTSYRLKTGPQVKYQFNVPEEKVGSVARTMDFNFHLLLAELSTR